VAALDLQPWIGQRSVEFRFQLVNGTTGFHKGDIHPLRTSPPTLTHDTSRTIKRQLSPVVLYRDDAELINAISDRLLVYAIVGGVEYPLGRYTFTDDTTIRTTEGDVVSLTLLDEMFIVDQEIDVGFSAQGATYADIETENVNSMIKRLLRDLPITSEVDPTAFFSIGSWAQSTSRAKILDDLTLDGNYFPAWCNNEGILRVITAFDPAAEVATFDWDSHHVVDRDSITVTDDLLSAPNRFIVVSNHSISSTVPVVGTFDVPISAPHSIANRGFIIPKTFSLPVDTITQAQTIARNLATRQTVFERVTLTTPIDPRHDSFDIVRWEDENWLELSWSMPLTADGEMSHTLRKVYEE
jgi:hypothetical protein